MPPGDGWTSKLLAGLAQHLDDAGIATYRASGAYTSDEIGIVIRGIPQSPDRLITLAPYRLAESLPGMADWVQGLQVRCRGVPDDPRDAQDLDDAVLELLDSCGRLTLGDVVVVDITHRSGTSLGQDGNHRWETSSNYAVAAMRPTANRTD